MLDWFYNKPEIDDFDYFYMEAWQELSTCRAIGMGVGPIPWLAIDRYCERLELSYQASDDFTSIIRVMDNAYLNWYNKKQEKERKKVKSG